MVSHLCRGDNERTARKPRRRPRWRWPCGRSRAEMPLFNIKCNNGTTVSVEAELTCKVLDFKELISPKADVPAALKRTKRPVK